MKRFRMSIFGLAAADLIVSAAGLFVWSWVFDGRHDAILSFTVFAVAVVTFFGALSLGKTLGGEWQPSKAGLRNAIAVSVIVTHFLILALYIFLKSPNEPSLMTQNLVTNFTMIVGVVIAFYFGTSAYVQVRQLEQEGQKPEKTKEEDTE